MVTRFLAWMGKGGALAAMLVLLALAWAGTADAAESHHDHHPSHHPVAAAADSDAGGDTDDGGGPHRGGDCQCVSAACSPVLAVSAPHFVPLPVVAVHAPTLAHDAAALAAVDPPAEPPRV